jgi:hypothetical protein
MGIEFDESADIVGRGIPRSSGDAGIRASGGGASST